MRGSSAEFRRGKTEILFRSGIFSLKLKYYLRYYYHTMKKPKRIQNDKKRLRAVEAKFGGPVKAARAVNVSYTSWHRWVNNLRAVTPHVDRALDLVLSDLIHKASNGS